MPEKEKPVVHFVPPDADRFRTECGSGDRGIVVLDEVTCGNCWSLWLQRVGPAPKK